MLCFFYLPCYFCSPLVFSLITSLLVLFSFSSKLTFAFLYSLFTTLPLSPFCWRILFSSNALFAYVKSCNTSFSPVCFHFTPLSVKLFFNSYILSIHLFTTHTALLSPRTDFSSLLSVSPHLLHPSASYKECYMGRGEDDEGEDRGDVQWL